MAAGALDTIPGSGRAEHSPNWPGAGPVRPTGWKNVEARNIDLRQQRQRCHPHCGNIPDQHDRIYSAPAPRVDDQPLSRRAAQARFPPLNAQRILQQLDLLAHRLRGDAQLICDTSEGPASHDRMKDAQGVQGRQSRGMVCHVPAFRCASTMHCQMTAFSTNGRFSRMRSYPTSERSSVRKPPYVISSDTPRPAAGPCCRPCPEKPLA